MHSRRLQQGLVPTLDGARLKVREDDDILTHADGTPVSDERIHDVVYLNPNAEADQDAWWVSVALVSLDGVLYDEPVRAVSVEGETFTDDDVADMLAAVADAHAPARSQAVEAAFFHQTLLAWLGEAHADEPPRPIPWPSGLWKATLDEEEVPDTVANADPLNPDAHTHAFAAHVYAGDSSAPMTFRYWVRFDDEGTVIASGWLSPPPDLFGVAEEADKRRAADKKATVVVPDLYAD